MNKIKALFVRLTGITISFVLLISSNACNLPVPDNSQSFSAQIIQPTDNAHLILGVQVDIETRVTTPGSVRSVSLLVNGQLEREDLFSNPSFKSGTVYQPWTPNTPGTYTLQVYLENDKGQVASNIVTVNVGKEVPFAPSLEATSTETPATATETQTTTPTPDKPQATANQNASCRKGPGTAYSYSWDFLAGQTVPIVGRNENNTWLVVERLDGNGQCWVWTELVNIQGNIDSLPVIAPPPEPITETPKSAQPLYSACGDYPDYGTCLADPMNFGGCSWDTGLNRCLP